MTGSPEAIEQAARDSGAGVFPGWEFYAPVAGADRTIFSLLPEARVILDEPEALAAGIRQESGPALQKRTSAAASATWFAPPIFISPRKSGEKQCNRFPAPTSNTSPSLADVPAVSSSSMSS